LSTLSLRALVTSYLEAERRRDAAAVAEHFCADGVLVDANGARHAGRAAVRRAYEDIYGDLSVLDVHLVGVFLDTDRGAIEWIADAVRTDGVVAHLRGVSVVRMQSGGFTELRVYLGSDP